MSGVEVLAVISRALDHGEGYTGKRYPEAREACAAVAELIEADKEYDEAHQAGGSCFCAGMLERQERASERRDVALIRCGGAQ